MPERTLAGSGTFVPIFSAFVDLLDFDDWQVQFVQRFEHAAQFCLVADMPAQFDVRRVCPAANNGDLHAGQPVTPLLAQYALGDDPIEGRSTKFDIRVLHYAHSHVLPTAGFSGPLFQRHAGRGILHPIGWEPGSRQARKRP